MKLNSGNLDKFRKGDLTQYFNNILSIVTDPKATTLVVSNERIALANTMITFNEQWQVAKGSELTPQIADLDNQRDGIFSGLKGTVTTWAKNHYDMAQKNAAFIIANKIASYGSKITLMRYQQQTATLNAIISDLENELAEEVTLLALTPWVTTLKDLNTQFDTKYVERAKALSLEEDGIIAELRAKAIDDFKTLKTILEARMTIATVENSENLAVFNEVANEWNTLTNQYNDAVTRTTTKANQDNGDTPQENPDDTDTSDTPTNNTNI